MTPTNWYSAGLRLAIINEIGGLWREVLSVILLRAASYDEAFHNALSRGREMEEVYTNGDGERVRWALVCVETLDCLASDLVDGGEIYSGPAPERPGAVPGITFDAVFSPDSIDPGQTGV